MLNNLMNSWNKIFAILKGQKRSKTYMVNMHS